MPKTKTKAEFADIGLPYKAESLFDLWHCAKSPGKFLQPIVVEHFDTMNGESYYYGYCQPDDIAGIAESASKVSGVRTIISFGGSEGRKVWKNV